MVDPPRWKSGLFHHQGRPARRIDAVYRTDTVLRDVPNRCQIKVRLRRPFFDGRVEFDHLVQLLARHSCSSFLLLCRMMMIVIEGTSMEHSTVTCWQRSPRPLP